MSDVFYHEKYLIYVFCDFVNMNIVGYLLNKHTCNIWEKNRYTVQKINKKETHDRVDYWNYLTHVF
jgi:hypothetical protein